MARCHLSELVNKRRGHGVLCDRIRIVEANRPVRDLLALTPRPADRTLLLSGLLINDMNRVLTHLAAVEGSGCYQGKAHSHSANA